MTRNKEAQAAMSARKLFYLGPQGTFTHQAAVNAAQELARLEPQGFDLIQILCICTFSDGAFYISAQVDPFIFLLKIFHRSQVQ